MPPTPASGDGAFRWRDGSPHHSSGTRAGWSRARIATNLVALRGLDGEVLWHRPLASPARIAPAISGRQLYVPLESGHVTALAVQTGTPLWTRRLPGPATGILALDDQVYVGSTDNCLYKLAASNGDIAWRWRTGGDLIGAPVADRDRVYFVGLDNELRALDGRSGALRWQRPLPIRPSTGPLQAGEILIIAGVAVDLRAYRARDGAPAGEMSLKSPEGRDVYFVAPPHLVGSPPAGLLVLTRDGRLQHLAASAP